LWLIATLDFISLIKVSSTTTLKKRIKISQKKQLKFFNLLINLSTNK